MGTLTYSTQEVQTKLDSIDLIDAKFGTYPRPNLLDNWYFVGGGSQQGGGQLPINQMGQTSWSGTGPTIDRFTNFTSRSYMTLTSTGVRFGLNTTSSADTRITMQKIPNLNDIIGKTLTVSVLVTGTSGGSFMVGCRVAISGGSIQGNTDCFRGSVTPGLYSKTFTVSSDATEILFRIANSAGVELTPSDYIELAAAKVELGSTQTLAHQENGEWMLNEIPNYQQELEKCQRYQLELVPPGNSAIGCVGGGTPTSTTQCYVFVPTPTELRTVPTLSYAGTWKLVREGTAPASGAAVSAMSVVNRSANGVTLQITSSGLSTSYRYDLWYTAADVTNKLLLSANL